MEPSVVVGIIVLLIVAIGVVWAFRSRHPEETAGHWDGSSPQEGMAGGRSDRPAGPDAEDDAVADRGEVAPDEPEEPPSR